MRTSTMIFLLAISVSGCAAHGTREAVTSGLIGCPPSEIQISDADTGWTTNTWKARCRGKVYYCTQFTGQRFSCTEETK